MKMNLSHWLGIAGAGFVGALIFSAIERVWSGDSDLLVSHETVGAMLGAIVTIVTTLGLERSRRRSERREQIEPLQAVVSALRIFVARARLPVIPGLELAQRNYDTTQAYLTIGHTYEAFQFARESANLRDLKFWTANRAIEAAFGDFKVNLVNEARLLQAHEDSEDVWRIAQEKLATFAAELEPNVDRAITALAALA